VGRRESGEARIGVALRQADAGTSVPEICRKLSAERNVLPLEPDIRRQEVSEVRRFKQREEENRLLKPVVAVLTLDKAMLQDIVPRKW
jgi:putative transposase